MAKKVRRTVTKSRNTANNVEWNFPLAKNNLYILVGGLAVIILGYLAMATGLGSEYAMPEGEWNSPMAIVIGPMLLVFAYLVIIPFGILKVYGSNSDNNTSEENEPNN